MKKKNSQLDFFDTARVNYKSVGLNKIKTTNINILLNRVKINKKIEFKKKIIFSSLIFLFTAFVGIFFLFLY